jgi:hypothetical protein
VDFGSTDIGTTVTPAYDGTVGSTDIGTTVTLAYDNNQF